MCLFFNQCFELIIFIINSNYLSYLLKGWHFINLEMVMQYILSCDMWKNA